MNPNYPISRNPNYSFTPTGIDFKEALSHPEWDDLGKMLAAMHKVLGFFVGDWINFGEKAYREKYKKALATTGIPYNTLKNYASVAKRVKPALREKNLGFEFHSSVAKFKSFEQKKWLEMAETHNLSIRRFRKSIKLGRLATEEETDDNPADRAQISHLVPINGFVRWFTSETSKTPVHEWPDEWRQQIKNDLKPILDIMNQL